jgi:hypothetical protein
MTVHEAFGVMIRNLSFHFDLEQQKSENSEYMQNVECPNRLCFLSRAIVKTVE